MSKIYTFNDKIVTINNKWAKEYAAPAPVDPYNPLGLPANTVRVRTSDGAVPGGRYDTATLVSGTSDVYDVYKSGTNFTGMFSHSSNIVEVLGANTAGITSMLVMFLSCTSLTSIALFDTSNVTSMAYMFECCESLTSVPLFDTSSVTDTNNMFKYCYSLTTIPLFNTSNITNMDSMFTNCYNVQSGALALYQQASSQTNPPTNHYQTFFNCGSDTTTGAAELAQIPSDWSII